MKLSEINFDVAVVERLLRSDDGMKVIDCAENVQDNCITIITSAFPILGFTSEGSKNVFAYIEKPVKRRKLLEIVGDAVKHTK